MRLHLVMGVLISAVACSGGTDKSPPVTTPTAPTATLPTVSLTVSAPKVFVGDSVSITWSSTNATSCVASGAWTDAKAIQGTQRITTTAGGIYWYRLTCSNDNKTAADSVKLIVPMPVYPTSYENKNIQTFDKTQLPSVRALGIPRVQSDEQDSNERSVTFADFTQQGTFSAFVASTRATNRFGIKDLSDAPAIGYFLVRNDRNEWEDRSNELFATIADRTLCVSTSYSLVADFNNDKKPDIWIACSGVDADQNLFPQDQQREVMTSEQVVLLSTPTGKYEKHMIAERLYGHQAAAADINGDGNIDILTSDAWNLHDRLPIVFLGDGKGGFARRDDLVPSSVGQKTNGSGAVFNLWIIPDAPYQPGLQRKQIVVFASLATTFISPDFRNGLLSEQYVDVSITSSAKYNVVYDFPLDVVLHEGNLILHHTARMSWGTEWAVVRYAMNGRPLQVVDVWENATASLQRYSSQFKPTSDGFLVAYTGACHSPTYPSQGRCAMHVPLR